MRWKQGCRYEKERLCWPQDRCPKRHGTASSQEMPASPRVATEPSAVPEAEHRSVEGARSGCWSPAVSLRPQTPLESTTGHWEPEEKGAARREGSSIPDSPLSAPAARAPHSMGSPGQKCCRKEGGCHTAPMDHTPCRAVGQCSPTTGPACTQALAREGESKQNPLSHTLLHYLFLAVM